MLFPIIPAKQSAKQASLIRRLLLCAIQGVTVETVKPGDGELFS